MPRQYRREHHIKEENEEKMSTRRDNAIERYLIMELYGVTIKHLQNIHKVMQSVDNTFISIIYLQIKILNLERRGQMLLSHRSPESNLLFVMSYIQ